VLKPAIGHALFQHDTSRALDPQAHIHAIVANMTKAGRQTHALHADRWSSNSVIGSIYHSFLRDELEKLGYQVQMTVSTVRLEIAGVPESKLETFSQP
jgi:conjugative relaxase-like TrwC/TraI family protein